MDLVGCLLLDEFVAKPLEVIFDGDIGDMGGDAQPLRQLFDLAEPFGFRQGGGRNVAHRDIAAFCDKLTGQLPTHTRAAASDDSYLTGKILHRPLPVVFRLALRHAVLVLGAQHGVKPQD